MSVSVATDPGKPFLPQLDAAVREHGMKWPMIRVPPHHVVDFVRECGPGSASTIFRCETPVEAQRHAKQHPISYCGMPVMSDARRVFDRPQSFIEFGPPSPAKAVFGWSAKVAALSPSTSDLFVEGLASALRDVCGGFTPTRVSVVPIADGPDDFGDGVSTRFELTAEFA